MWLIPRRPYTGKKANEGKTLSRVCRAPKGKNTLEKGLGFIHLAKRNEFQRKAGSEQIFGGLPNRVKTKKKKTGGDNYAA